MVTPSSLLIEKPGGEQVVRRPYRSDTVGTVLQRVYAVRRAVPDVIAKLLVQIDQRDDDRRRALTGRR